MYYSIDKHLGNIRFKSLYLKLPEPYFGCGSVSLCRPEGGLNLPAQCKHFLKYFGPPKTEEEEKEGRIMFLGYSYEKSKSLV